MKSIIILLSVIGSALSNPASAQLKDENLLMGQPEGYVVAFENRQGKNLIVERIPDGESVNDWTEMITTIIRYGTKDLSPKQAYEQERAKWNTACTGAGGKLYFDGVENGYSIAIWLLVCPKSPVTGKLEITLFKAIAGDDSFYFVQKAWSRKPSIVEFEFWAEYMKSVRVCDTRRPETNCPEN